jgi:undecaprenyl diphosphate synthase
MAIPNHLAVIPDGNRRWARAGNLNPWDGHTEGVRRFWDIADYAFEAGVKYLTFWGSSYGNLTKRNKLEIAFLLKLLREELSGEKMRKKLIESQCRVRLIGEWKTFIKDKKTSEAIESVIIDTAHFTKSNLTILFAYDGQREMLAAINSLNGQKATDTSIRKHLWTGILPDVDLVIRTGGEPHWSAGFMMWLTANSQFYFTDMLWPMFNGRQLATALEDYNTRERRKGK